MVRTIIILDFGTSNVRVNAINIENGVTLASNSEKYKSAGQAGYCELDADEMWLKAQICMQKTISDLALDLYQVCGISFSFFGDCLIPVDIDGNPTYHLILCFDPRGAVEAQEINEIVGEKRVLELIGDIYESGCTGAKILYFKRYMAQIDAVTEKYYTIQQFILRKLGLKDVNDITMACRKSLMDNKNRIWSEELMEAAGIHENQLGEIVMPDTRLGEITMFGKVKLPYSVPVFPGAHDSDCGYVGLGINTETKTGVAEVAGTFDHIGMIVNGYVNCHLLHPDKDIWSGLGPFPDSSSCLSAYPTSGALLEWFMQEIMGNTLQETYRTLWNSVVFDGKGKISLSPAFAVGNGAVSGLTITSTKQEIFQAIIEMLTFETRRCIELCQELKGKDIDFVRIGGGGAREEKWVQLRADITGKVYHRMNEIESSALGAAMIASVGLGIYSDFAMAAEKMVSIQKSFVPNPEVHKAYEKKYIQYVEQHYL